MVGPSWMRADGPLHPGLSQADHAAALKCTSKCGEAPLSIGGRNNSSGHAERGAAGDGRMQKGRRFGVCTLLSMAPAARGPRLSSGGVSA